MALTRNAKSRPEGTSRFGDKARRPGGGLSLKGRALKFLSQREHSRLELTRKLARYEPEPGQVEQVLDELEQLKFLSSERFVESLVNRRSGRFGIRRIVQELGQHQIDGELSAEALARLKDTEFERAWDIWQRRFGHAPVDLADRGRQHRFLAQRGFASETIFKVFKAAAGTQAEG